MEEVLTLQRQGKVLEVYALHLSRDLAYIVGVAPINSTLCNTFHHELDA
jgi:hypothetical protein